MVSNVWKVCKNNYYDLMLHKYYSEKGHSPFLSGTFDACYRKKSLGLIFWDFFFFLVKNNLPFPIYKRKVGERGMFFISSHFFFLVRECLISIYILYIYLSKTDSNLIIFFNFIYKPFSIYKIKVLVE